MIQPPNLKAGDSVGFVAPSRRIFKDQLKEAVEIIRGWELNVIEGSHLYSSNGYFAGHDSQRKNDMQQMLDDSNIKAIFCARGGYGLSRIIDSINFEQLQQNPKWVIGFSDITALHLKCNRQGIQTIHGLMPVQYGYEGVNSSLRSLKCLLFENYFSHEFDSFNTNREGKTSGELVGGNLSLILDSLGTATEIDTKNRILFIEEIDEYLYKIDRMLNQLKRAGKLDKINGLMVGQFTDLKDTQIPFGAGLEEIVLSHIDNENVPIAFQLPFGHEAHNIALPCGRKVSMEVNADMVKLYD